MDKQCRKGPICNDCYSASAARTPWRTKPNRQTEQIEDKRASLSPGDVISVDQLETSTPGFVGQITGILTRQRIVGSTIFVDQASDMGYVYHHLSMSSEETVKAKESFERYARSHSAGGGTELVSNSGSKTVIITGGMGCFQKQSILRTQGLM